MKSDTIVAVITPLGVSGIGGVRLSGPESKSITLGIVEEKFLNTPLESHRVYKSFFYGKHHSQIDFGMFVWMQAPNSYTGEDTVEFFLHGNPLILKHFVEVCTASGARLAEPGEFSKRSFLNGKMDLVQAEAVSELIHAESEVEIKSAQDRLGGHLSNIIQSLYTKTIDLLSECEADVDFPDENLPLAERHDLLNVFEENKAKTKSLLSAYKITSQLREGFSIVLAGAPNAGKSSLFNAFLNVDRAIVTDIPGTTRDVLKETFILNGFKVLLMDTAGLREKTKDKIEKMGMELGEEEIKKANVVLWVVDATQPQLPPKHLMGHEKVWILYNKMDLSDPKKFNKDRNTVFFTSAKDPSTLNPLIEQLKQNISQTLLPASLGGVSNDRQWEKLNQYQASLEEGQKLWQSGKSTEFAAQALRKAVHALAAVLGKNEPDEDVLSHIFSKFCIGK